MATNSFDPYHKWLGISPQQQPADYYRLLGIDQFEADPDVIDAAAERQMGYLKNYKSGPHADACNQLLNEVASARICLLNPESRAEYDAELRSTAGLENDFSPADPIPTIAVKPARAPSYSWLLPVAVGASLVLVVLVIVVIRMDRTENSKTVSTDSEQTNRAKAKQASPAIGQSGVSETGSNEADRASSTPTEELKGPVDLIEFADLGDADNIAWQLKDFHLHGQTGNDPVYLSFKHSVPRRYELVLRFVAEPRARGSSSHEVHLDLPVGDVCFPFIIRYDADGSVRFSFLPDGDKSKLGEPPFGIRPEEVSTLRRERHLKFQVNENEVSVSVDRRHRFRLSTSENANRKAGDRIAVAGRNNKIEIYQFQLSPP